MGVILVPVGATDEMEAAGADASARAITPLAHASNARRIYAAMIAARPKEG